MTSAQPPSFLVVMADQLAASWLPVYGHPLVQAPHLSLARDATVFDNAYTPFPLCAPARSAMITGRLASDIGVYDNAAELAATVPTLAHALRAHGYHTAVAGKMTLRRARPTAWLRAPADSGHYRPTSTGRRTGRVRWTGRFPGTTRWRAFSTRACARRRCRPTTTRRSLFSGPQALRHRPPPADEPFLLFVSFTNPHDPWEIPQRHWQRYRRSDIPDPQVPSLPLAQADPHSRRLRAMCRVDEASLTAEQIRRARHAYFAAVSYLDERVGEVLERCSARGWRTAPRCVLRRPWRDAGRAGPLVQDVVFRAVSPVPLIFRVPGAAPRRVAEPVSLLDVTPTLLGLASLPVSRAGPRSACASRSPVRARAGSAGRLRVPRRGGHGTVGDGP